MVGACDIALVQSTNVDTRLLSFPHMSAPALDLRVSGSNKRASLANLLAWTALGANGLAAACYGPERAFRALGEHAAWGPWMAVAGIITVYFVTNSCMQLIRLFPNGAGGYQITSQMLGPRIGLISGCAHMVEFCLALVVSIASGVDSLFSLLPVEAQSYKFVCELLLLLLLATLNLRGMRESVALLVPVTVGFVIFHACLIAYGLAIHPPNFAAAIGTPSSTVDHAALGLFSSLFLFMRAFTLGGSTYTSVDTVSNNVNVLAEPRTETGRATARQVSWTLSVLIAGLFLLYSAWHQQVRTGATLTSAVLAEVLSTLPVSANSSHALLLLGLGLQGGILLVAANSIFLFGPALLGHMSADSWIPHRFRNLSDRLVRRNGVLFFTVGAIAILLASQGDVGVLLVYYSINAFVGLVLTKLGLCRYWWTARGREPQWQRRLTITFIGTVLTSSILGLTLIDKMLKGAWVIVVVTSGIVIYCLWIRRHYAWVDQKRQEMDTLFTDIVAACPEAPPLAPDAARSTAIFLVTEHIGAAMHQLLWVQRLFPERFRNAVFVSAIEFDANALHANQALQAQFARVKHNIAALERFCAANGIASAHYVESGPDAVNVLYSLVLKAAAEFSESVCFSSKFILPSTNAYIETLHNHTSANLQRRLHAVAIPLVILALALH